MQETDKLSELVHQAASTINMLSPTDMSELENLQTILDQIKQNIGSLDGASVLAKCLDAALLEHAKGATSDAAEAAGKILQSDAQDVAKLIETITQAVVSLQSFTSEIESAAQSAPSTVEPSSPPAEADGASQAEKAPADGVVIAQEDIPLVLDFAAEAMEHIESVEAGLLELESKPGDTEVLNKIFRGFHTIKGMAGFLNLAPIGSLAHSAENLLDMARKGKLALAGQNTDIVLESADMMKKMVSGLRASVEAGKPITGPETLPGLVARLAAAAEGRNSGLDPNSPQGQQADKHLESTLTTRDDSSARGTTANTQISAGDEKIKVSITRLDNLVNMVGELVVAQLMVTEGATAALASDHSFCRKVTHQSKIVRELQELSMAMRMVPIQGVFQKMARLVRDLSRKSGKDINFSTVGEQTELDRTVVDKITDPLVHMVRNSIDHGVETPEERVKAGKSPTGHIELRAFHEAGNIVIEIQDDGKGLNKERILQKGVENGIVAPGQELSEEEIFKLIFHAGLSTAEKVTSISGRGVGMDVVKKNVEALRGRIDISSSPGKGTTFTIRLPLTLAIIDGQVVTVGASRYIIPINAISCSLRPSREQLTTIQRRGEIAKVQGSLIPVIRLYKLFGVAPATEDPTKSLLVVVEDDGSRCGLLVDDLSGQQQVVIKNLGDGMGQVKGVSGGAIMGDGKVSLILDIPGLMELSRTI